MPIHENREDRDQQSLAGFQMERHIRMLGVPQVTLIPTEEHYREHYDFRIMHNSMWVGVVEVKCRWISSQQLKDWGSVVIEVERLKHLRQMFTVRSEITGKSTWTKSVVMLFRCVRDDICFSVHMDDIIANWDALEDAGPEMMKDNHGDSLADKSGKLFPVNLMSEFT